MTRNFSAFGLFFQIKTAKSGEWSLTNEQGERIIRFAIYQMERFGKVATFIIAGKYSVAIGQLDK